MAPAEAVRVVLVPAQIVKLPEMLAVTDGFTVSVKPVETVLPPGPLTDSEYTPVSVVCKPLKISVAEAWPLTGLLSLSH
jgi:hypothetical protein